jgi:hypothetical protein
MIRVAVAKRFAVAKREEMSNIRPIQLTERRRQAIPFAINSLGF